MLPEMGIKTEQQTAVYSMIHVFHLTGRKWMIPGQTHERTAQKRPVARAGMMIAVTTPALCGRIRNSRSPIQARYQPQTAQKIPITGINPAKAIGEAAYAMTRAVRRISAVCPAICTPACTAIPAQIQYIPLDTAKRNPEKRSGMVW